MAGSHVGFDFNFEDLRSEQVDIDKLVDCLLNGNSSGGNASMPSSSGINLQQKKYSKAVSTPVPDPVPVKRGQAGLRLIGPLSRSHQNLQSKFWLKIFPCRL